MIGVRHDVSEKLSIEVGDSKASAESLVDETLKSPPENVHGHFRLCEEVVWPVQVVHVHIVCLQSLKTLPQGRLRIPVARVPEFGGEEDVFTLDSASGDCLFNAFSHLCLIHRDRSRVNVSIADISNGMCDCLSVLVEQSTKTHDRHVASIA